MESVEKEEKEISHAIFVNFCHFRIALGKRIFWHAKITDWPSF